MSENRCCSSGNGNTSSNTIPGNGTVCIDTYRVLDSCRDRDCYENVVVYLSEDSTAIIQESCNVRITGTDVLWTSISISEVPFNYGFYQLNLRFYIQLTIEVCNGGSRCILNGLAIVEKTAILYGGQGESSVFRSTGEGNICCPVVTQREKNLPIGVVETVDPIVLSSKIVDCSCHCPCNCYTCCSCADIPSEISDLFPAPLVNDTHGKILVVSLGLFSVIRMERSAQILVNATDYSVPDKECVTAQEDDPCSLFRTLAFPVSEFTGMSCCGSTPPTCESHACGNGSGRSCTCQRDKS